MPSITYGPVLGDIVKHEYSRETCREAGTLLTGTSYKLGAVLGRRAVATGAGAITPVAAGAGVGGANTGNGAFTAHASAPTQAGAVAGVYKVVFIEPAANLGTFQVERPDGSIVGQGVVGTEFNNEIRFTIADGATDFVAGDGFAVTVGAGDGKWVMCQNAAQADGSHIPDGILLDDYDATGGDKAAVALVRGPAILSPASLVWHSSVDDANKRAAKLALLTANTGILTRVAA